VEKMKMSLLLQLTLLGLAFYLFCVLFMYLSQDSQLFYPPAADHSGETDERLVAYQLVREEATLKGWLVNPAYAREKLLVYYGGNAEDIFYTLDEFRDIQAASLFVSYRGYGPSSGRPSEAALFADALAVLDDIRGRHTPRQTFLLGRSLGSGVASFVAASREVSGVVLITPFDSMVNLARQHYPWLPVGMLLRHRFDSVQHLAGVRAPLLIIYGGQDQVVPPVRTENLIRHVPGGQRVLFLEHADHGNVDLFPEYWPAVLDFINRDEAGST
jgi:pimeloyl-ACP methyl ester carboxylesterase